MIASIAVPTATGGSPVENKNGHPIFLSQSIVTYFPANSTIQGKFAISPPDDPTPSGGHEAIKLNNAQQVTYDEIIMG